jgi:hypothetical protein
MTDLINLRRARKAKARTEKDKQAQANRVAYGTPKTLRDLEKARAELTARWLENRRLDSDIDQDK